MYLQRLAFAALLLGYFTVSGSGLALAQSGQNGSIVGMVLDQSGMPLKGIKVTVTSDTQIGGPKNAYSNDEGGFRFVALHPGQFELRAAAPKLRQVVVKGIDVGVSAPTEVNVVMEVETATEEIAVVERAPVINTRSATIKETIDLDMIESMPLDNRDQPHNQLIGMVAGASGNRVRGGSASQTRFTQDGFDMRDQQPTTKTSAAYEILTGGQGGDAPAAAGASVNLVTKSGSNKFEFEFNATADSNRLTFFRDEGDPATATYYYALNPTVAGPIIKDKLWYFFNAEAHFIQENRAWNQDGIFPQRPPFTKFIPKGTFKLTWQVSRRNKLTSLSNFDAAREYNRKDEAGVEPEAQERRLGRRLFTGLIWESLLSDSLVLRSQAGITYFGEHIFPELCIERPLDCDHIPGIKQSFPQDQEWINSDAHTRNDAIHLQFVNRMDWFLDSKRFGEHNIKFQSTLFSERDIEMTSVPGDNIIQYNGSAAGGAGQREPQNQTTYFSNDPRISDARYGWYIEEVNWMRHVATLSDAYRATRYLTISPAISHIYGKSFSTNGSGTFNSGAFSPSLSAAWDATHDGRTVLRGSYSALGDVEVKRFAEHNLGGRVSERCNWNSTTQAFDSGCTYSGGASSNTVGLPCGSTGLDAQGRSCREKLKIPRTHEVTMGAEREVAPGVAIGLDGMYRAFRNQFDTRETNRRWNNSGTGLTLSGAFKNGRNQEISDLGTPSTAKRNWMGATLTAKKREGRFRVQGSYTLSKLEGAGGAYGDNPGQDIYLWGYLGDDHRHEVKALSTYRLTNWLTTGIRYSYRSGTPYNRIYRNPVTNDESDYRARLGVNPGTNVNDPGDDRELRLPDLMSFNLQARVNLQQFIGQRLEFFVDVLNVLATRTVTAIEETEGPAFGRGTGRQGPFKVRLGLNYRY
jgi:hypothetical protein